MGAKKQSLDRSRQDDLYSEAARAYAAAIRRLARGYEADPEKQRDLLQEIHVELWRSLGSFDGRCSLRTWVYRVAHNVGASHVVRDRRARALLDLEALEADRSAVYIENQIHRRLSANALLELIYRLNPLERQVILMYLEGESAADIAAVSGLTATNVATKVHRIKKLLRQQYRKGDADAM